jgi:predicted Fe-Mo cluster-binding NifX family protein
MKIAVASNNENNVTGHLGRCRGFLIYEIEGDKVISKEYRENVFTHHHLHGSEENHEHGHSHTGLIEGLKDCSVLIFNSGGWRVIEDLKSNNIYPFLTNETDADKSVRLYINHELTENLENSCNLH